jgi:quinol monooxygenase YgiN
MSVVVTALPVPGHRAEVIAPFEGGDRAGSRRTRRGALRAARGNRPLVMIEKYKSEQARPEHAKGAALAGLRSALEGKLSGLGTQVLVPHPAGNAQKGAL